MNSIERWSTAAVLAGVAGLGLLLCAAIGWAFGGATYWESVAIGVVVVVIHATLSIAAGWVAASAVGVSTTVGAHLGVYHLLTPLAVVARVNWLRRHRPRLIRAGFLMLFFGVYGVLALAVVLAACPGFWWR